MTEQSKSSNTRQRILEAGRTLVARNGFGAVGLSRILAQSGVPKGSFYYYFASKDDFGQALLAEYVAQYLHRFDALAAGPGSAGDKLDGFWTAWLSCTGQDGEAGIATDCLVVKLGAEVADLSPDMRRVLHEGVEALVARIADLLRAGGEDGSLRVCDDPDRMARMLYAKWLGAAILAKLSRSESPLRDALAETRDQLTPKINS